MSAGFRSILVFWLSSARVYVKPKPIEIVLVGCVSLHQLVTALAWLSALAPSSFQALAIFVPAPSGFQSPIIILEASGFQAPLEEWLPSGYQEAVTEFTPSGFQASPEFVPAPSSFQESIVQLEASGYVKDPDGRKLWDMH